jgi:hypothetical protein
MLTDKFFNANGRYKRLDSTRFMATTYGRHSFESNQAEDETPLFHGTYGALLFDKRWIERRKQILHRDEYSCVICQAKENLQIHHRQYHYIKALKQFKPPWDYEDKLMITLCDNCHTRGHNKFKIPSISI